MNNIRRRGFFRNEYQKTAFEQRVSGIALLVISAFILFLAFTGKTCEATDATPVVFTIPLGLMLLFGRVWRKY